MHRDSHGITFQSVCCACELSAQTADFSTGFLAITPPHMIRFTSSSNHNILVLWRVCLTLQIFVFVLGATGQNWVINLAVAGP